jgi:hypothetical protein
LKVLRVALTATEQQSYAIVHTRGNDRGVTRGNTVQSVATQSITQNDSAVLLGRDSVYGFLQFPRHRFPAHIVQSFGQELNINHYWRARYRVTHFAKQYLASN